VSELAPASIRTSIGDVTAIFALDAWVMLEVGAHSTQSQCRRPKELAARLASFGLPADEAGKIAHELWRRRPSDASMQSDSQSVVMAIGNQWVVAIIVVLVIALIVVAFALRRTMTGQ
jgi:hypothetical protein